MKKRLFILILILVLLTMALSFGCTLSNKVSNKINGTFEGILPAADCPGLQTIIAINSDGTFHMEETFLERDTSPRVTEGNWVLKSNIITFTAGDYKFEYKVISDKEIRWAPGGKEITGTNLNWSLLKK